MGGLASPMRNALRGRQGSGRGGGVVPDFVTMPCHIRTADKAQLDVSAGVEVSVRAALTDWTPSATNALVTKWKAAGSRSFYCGISGSSASLFISSADGTTNNRLVSGTAPPFTDGVTYWLRYSLTVATGVIAIVRAADQVDEPSSWTALASQTAATSSIFNSTANLVLGSFNDGASDQMSGRMYRAIVRDSPGGTIIADFNAATAAGRSSYDDAYGNTWLIG